MKRISIEDPSVPKHGNLLSKMHNRANDVCIQCDIASSFVYQSQERGVRCTDKGFDSSGNCRSNNNVIIKQYSGNGNEERCCLILVRAEEGNNNGKRSYPFANSNEDESAMISIIKKFH